jgi:hypothetical protein
MDTTIPMRVRAADHMPVPPQAQHICSPAGGRPRLGRKTFGTTDGACQYENNCSRCDRVAIKPRSQTPEEENLDEEIQNRFGSANN